MSIKKIENNQPEFFKFSDEKEEIVMRKKKNFETWQYRSNRKNSRVGKRKRNVQLFKNQFEMERFLVRILQMTTNMLHIL